MIMCTSEVKLKLECKRKFHESVAQEVLQLKKRLTHLEEETSMMKQEMSLNRAEREMLLNDVYRQLKLVQFSLHPQDQTFGYRFCKKQEVGRSDGLSQVLYEDRNPSVFIRGGSVANSVADPGPAESIMPNILCLEYDK
ncbi:hypothetical protein L1987_45124 [Smallanthus sonchifolius]|uniref:Uncharacterized protein n=1 Tax=Smallanthus sonchifolius TaxID=185202 RepID=A0ACB9GS41_9ASTR|nr:hypothetical protein L1987_45124 [Smallanthus sonchifolius]